MERSLTAPRPALAGLVLLVAGCGGGGGGTSLPLPPPADPFAAQPLATPLQPSDMAGEWFGYQRTTQYGSDRYRYLYQGSLQNLHVAFDGAGALTWFDASLGFQPAPPPAMTILDAATGRLRITGSSRLSGATETRVYDLHAQDAAGGGRTLRGVWTSSDGEAGLTETFRFAPLTSTLTAADLAGTWSGLATRFGAASSIPLTLTIGASGSILGGSFEGSSITPGLGYTRVDWPPYGLASVRFDQVGRYFNLKLVVDPRARTATGFFGNEIVVEGRTVSGEVGGTLRISR